MTAAILFVTGLALWSAAGGRRELSIGLFGVALVATILWLDRHMTDPLRLAL